MVFDADLIARYDRPGPRYTSYPPANRFRADFTEEDYRHCARESNAEPIPRPLSIYVHIPFCEDVCYYCACNKVVTRDHARSSEYLAALSREIALTAGLYDRDRRVEQLHLGGGTPTFLGDSELADLLARLRAAFTFVDDASGEFAIEVDPRTVDEARIGALRRIGFNRLSFGVQDLDPDVQQAVHRVQPEARIAAVVTAARAAGFRSVNLDLMYGLPRQTRDTLERTLDKVIALAPDRLAVYNYAHLPERFAPQRRIAAEDLPSAAEKLAMFQRVIDRLTSAGYVYVGMDHFARADDELAQALRDGNLHRNFQGYSTRAECDLIGLGVSAISHVNDAFSQNEQDITIWRQRLASGHLPVRRGLLLEPDDLLRGRIIAELMCRGRVEFAPLEERWQFSFTRYFRKELRELDAMADDGLVELGVDSIGITPRGRLLVRSVAMVFDAGLGQEGEGARYSRTV